MCWCDGHIETEKNVMLLVMSPILERSLFPLSQKLHVNKSGKNDTTTTESSRSRSSSINTDASCNSVGTSTKDNEDQRCHDEKWDNQRQHLALPDNNTTSNTEDSNLSYENNDADSNNCTVPTKQNNDSIIITTKTNYHDDSETTKIVATAITKAIADADADAGTYIDSDDKEDDYDDYDNMCSICFEPFSNDQELSWSKTNKCEHVFHSECLMPWLMKHEDCPYCRTQLMTRQDFLDRTYTDGSSNDSNDEKKKKKKNEGDNNYEIVRSNSNGDLTREQQDMTNEGVEEAESNIQIETENDIESGRHTMNN